MAVTRRHFLRKASLGVAAASVVRARRLGAAPAGSVALVKGQNRTANLQEALDLVKDEVRQALGSRQLVIKPNNVVARMPLACTHRDALGAVVDWFQDFYTGEILIAECPAAGKGNSMQAFATLGYQDRLRSYHNIQFYDLMEEQWNIHYVLDRHRRSLPIRVALLPQRSDIFLVSLALLKTHDAAVATLAWKNIIQAATMRDAHGNDKRLMHQDPWGMNDNLLRIGKTCRPHLAVIDGFVGMEGRGPIWGDPVEMGVAVVGTDCIAVDRVCVELMGHEFADVGYLAFAANAGLGEGQMARIPLVGEGLRGLSKKFRSHPTHQWQTSWKQGRPK